MVVCHCSTSVACEVCRHALWSVTQAVKLVMQTCVQRGFDTDTTSLLINNSGRDFFTRIFVVAHREVLGVGRLPLQLLSAGLMESASARGHEVPELLGETGCGHAVSLHVSRGHPTTCGLPAVGLSACLNELLQ